MYQLFKDEMYGNRMDINLENKNLKDIAIKGMGKRFKRYQ